MAKKKMFIASLFITKKLGKFQLGCAKIIQWNLLNNEWLIYNILLFSH